MILKIRSAYKRCRISLWYFRMDFRKMLFCIPYLEHDLLYILEHDSNKYQQWKRIKADRMESPSDL